MSNKTKVVLEVGAQSLEFSVGIKEFNDYQNELLPDNKVAPSENFLAKCIKPEQKEDLFKLCDQGCGLEMAQLVAGEFKPDLEIKVKK